MLVLLNAQTRRYALPRELAKLLHTGIHNHRMDTRTNPIAIDWVDKHPGCGLKVVDLPDDFVDYRIVEDNYVETLLYVTREMRILVAQG